MTHGTMRHLLLIGSLASLAAACASASQPASISERSASDNLLALGAAVGEFLAGGDVRLVRSTLDCTMGVGLRGDATGESLRFETDTACVAFDSSRAVAFVNAAAARLSERRGEAVPVASLPRDLPRSAPPCPDAPSGAGSPLPNADQARGFIAAISAPQMRPGRDGTLEAGLRVTLTCRTARGSAGDGTMSLAVTTATRLLTFVHKPGGWTLTRDVTHAS